MGHRTFAHLAPLALLSTIAFTQIAHADGTVILDFAGNSNDAPLSVTTTPDGRIFVEVEVGNSPACGTFGLDANGTLLPAFGSNGRMRDEGEFCIHKPLLAADGSLVTLTGGGGFTGFVANAGLREDFAARLPVRVHNSSGQLVGTFPAAPVEVPQFRRENYRVLAQAPDGKWLVGGGEFVGSNSSCTTSWVVRRFNGDGTLDTTFAGGRLVLSVGGGMTGPGCWDATVQDIRVLPDGKIWVSGDGRIVRLTADGERDTSFGLNGLIQYSAAGPIRDVDSLGRAYLFSYRIDSQTGHPIGHFIRVNPDGGIDTTYQNPEGIVEMSKAELDSADRLVVFGRPYPYGTSPQTKGFIARYTSSGAPDTTFGGTGQVLVDVPGGQLATASVYCLGAVHLNDKLLMACNSMAGADPDAVDTNMVLSRFNTDGTLDVTFGALQEDSDVFPDPFTVAPKSAPYGTVYVESDPITITGINSPTKLGGDVSMGCTGVYSNPGTITSGQTFCVRAAAPLTPLGTVTYQVQVGRRVVPWIITATNSPADVIPDTFSFPSRINVAVGTEVFSDAVVISGITGRAAVTISGGGSSAYSLNCTGSLAGVPGTITNGETICIRHYSAPDNSASITSTLTIGGVTATFTSTTAAAPPPASPPPSSPPPSSPAPPPAAAQSSGGGGASDLLLLAPLALILSMSLTRATRRTRARREQAP
jgi:uncharacterized delta-60 repeat protein